MATMKKTVVKRTAKKYEEGGTVSSDSKNAKPTAKPAGTPKPKPKTVSQRIGDITLRDIKNAGEDALNLSTLGMYGKAKKKVKEVTGLKNGGTMKKAQSGTSLGMKSVKAGYDNNPRVTRADIITAAKGKAKSGAALKKQAATAIAMKKAGKAPKAAMKSGGSMKKCKYGCK